MANTSAVSEILASALHVVRLVYFFERGGYVRRAAPDRQAELGHEQYKKGSEVRITVQSEEELRELQKLLKVVGLRPGKPFSKHERWVQPVYGKEALDWFVARLPRGRDRSALGFAPDGSRLRRRRVRAEGEEA